MGKPFTRRSACCEGLHAGFEAACLVLGARTRRAAVSRNALVDGTSGEAEQVGGGSLVRLLAVLPTPPRDFLHSMCTTLSLLYPLDGMTKACP